MMGHGKNDDSFFFLAIDDREGKSLGKNATGVHS
jgi:hypothetical protein